MIPHSRAPDHEGFLKSGGSTSWDHKFSAAVSRGSCGSRRTPDSWADRWINVHQVVGYFVEEHHDRYLCVVMIQSLTFLESKRTEFLWLYTRCRDPNTS